MEEIKFRAKVKGCATPLDILTIDFGNCVVCIVDPECGSQKTFDWLEIEKFLRFTGLHDKNGKEIYEGDLLTIYNAAKTSTKYGEVVDVSAEVTFDNGQFTYLTKDYYGSPVYFPLANNIYGLEVIGNIYENPELGVK